MRVLLAPEVYRPDDLSANGTVNDLVTLVEQWLSLDDSLHVYWLLPPRETAGYGAGDVRADRERVTLVEAEPFMHGDEREYLFTEGGYSRDQLYALDRRIFDRDAYVDVAIDGHRTGRATLYKWLLEGSDHWAAQVRPFDVIADVHDLQLPFKYRWCPYRNDYQFRMEVCRALFADGVWFKAGVDARELRKRATAFLRPDAVEPALADAVETGSPVDFSAYDETYADRPEWLHLAGSLWDKKRTDRLIGLSRTLRERFGIRTVMTSMEEIPDEYGALDWVEAHPNADRETYERALGLGDLAVCASEYETMARTPFEQAASGQVLILRDEPWIHDCVPGDYALAGAVDELETLAIRAVEHWDEAVAENRRLVERVTRVRSPERAGRVTYEDLARRVESKLEAFDRGELPGPAGRLFDDLTADRVRLDALFERSASYTDDGRPVTELESVALSDLVYALRSLGYVDVGNAGTPVFERA
ncbi:glycosyltransferase [Halegenticoccus soli]|uniref:glycosyltransferase n=1 Tax=Halegenticoccus soli TaxID=1985678 RepID=UPI000C6CA3C7|nr:glycosyltransferase [Halegenticoccus soli]